MHTVCFQGPAAGGDIICDEDAFADAKSNKTSNPKSHPKLISLAAEESKERHSSGDSNDSLFSDSPTRFTVTSVDELHEPRPKTILPDGSELRGILKAPTGPNHVHGSAKAKKQRCFSESQTDLLSWHGSQSSVVSTQSVIREEDEDGGVVAAESAKKSVRFNETIRRQIFRPTSTIAGMTAKNQKKREQKRRQAQRRASEGDADSYSLDSKSKVHKDDEAGDKDEEEDHDDSGVASSVDEHHESKKGQSKKSSRRKRNNGNNSNSNKLQGKSKFLSESANDLIFDLDI